MRKISLKNISKKIYNKLKYSNKMKKKKLKKVKKKLKIVKKKLKKVKTKAAIKLVKEFPLNQLK